MDKFDAFSDLKWVLWVMVLIWFVWFLTGGPARYEAKSGIFLKPPAPLSTGETYGTPPSIDLKSPKLPDISNVSLFGKRVYLGLKTNLSTVDPGREYLELVGQSDSPINITGWKLVGSMGSSTIGKGVRVFRSGIINEESDIYLGLGDRVIISSGQSPVGASFRVNICSGYLEQFQDFSPELNSACPAVASLSSVKDYPLNSACLEYLDGLQVCETPTKKLPTSLSSACREFILDHTTYNSCVADNSSVKGFLTNELRVFLNSEKELWKNHDTIKFYDKNGTYLGSYTY